MIFSTLLIFIAVHYYIVWTHYSLFILNLVHLACFQFLSIVNSITHNIFMYFCGIIIHFGCVHVQEWDC